MSTPARTSARSSARRRALAFAGSLAAVALLAACGGGSESASDDGPVTIRLATQTPQSGEGAWRPTVAAFEKANPNIKVEIVETPTDTYPNVLRTQVQGGNAPDVFYGAPGRGNLNSVLSLGDGGFVEDLTGKAWAEKAVPENSKSLFEADGKLYAIPVDLAAVSIVTNKTALAENGITPPTTFDELLEQCTALQAKGKSWFAVAGSAGPNLGLQALQIAASTVYSTDPDWNAQRTAKKTTFASSAEWKQVLDDVVTMNKAGCYQQGAAGAGFGEITQAIASGSSMAIFAPSGAAQDIANGNPGGEFGQAVFPGATAADTRLSVSPNNALAVSADSEHQEAANKLLEYFTEPATQDAFAAAGGNLSLQSGETGQVPTDLADLTPFLQDSSKQVPLGFLGWPNGKVYDALGTGVQGLITGQATPEQVLTSLDQAWDSGS